MNSIFDDAAIEMAVIGDLLSGDADVIDAVSAIIEPRHMARTPHQSIFNAILSIHQQNNPVDIITVQKELERTGELKACGGVTYLMECHGQVVSAANAESHACLVLESAQRRILKQIGNEYITLSENVNIAADAMVDAAETKIMTLHNPTTRDKLYTMSDMQSIIFNALDVWNSGQCTIGTLTGFPKLDSITGGFQASDLILLAARPSVGKTAFAVNIAHHIADAGQKVLFLSMEMSVCQIAARMLSAKSGINTMLMRGGLGADSPLWQHIITGSRAFESGNMFLYDVPCLTVQEARRMARSCRRVHGLDILMLDYVQLMSGEKIRYESRQREVAYISQSLKAIAKEMNIPVLALSQLRRLADQEGNRVPKLSDLKESGSLEQDADLVMFLHRPDLSVKDDIHLHIAKHRNGKIGRIKLSFNGDAMQFMEVNNEIETTEAADEY